MSPTVQDILDIIETIAPAQLAETWDNVGLMLGDPSVEVTGILVGLDPTLQLLEEARDIGANLVVTHHPLIFHPLKNVDLSRTDGRFINLALQHRLTIISCHTNFDSALDGTSDTLARLLDLEDIKPLEPHDCGHPGCGLGRLGDFGVPLTPEEFLARLRTACEIPWMLGTGTRPESISRVAVCGGSCSELADKAFQAGAHVLVTAEVKHHLARQAEETGLWLIDAGHFATEFPGVRRLARLLAAETAGRFDEFPVRVATQQTSPLTLL